MTKNFYRVFWPVLIFFGLAILILGPFLFSRGYIFLLDYVVTPNDAACWGNLVGHGGLWNSLPFHLIQCGLFSVLPNDIAQKIILLALSTAIGSIFYFALPQKLGTVPRLIGGIFYLVNPFVWERFLAGHIGFLWGYAFLPLAIFGLYRAYQTNKTRDAILAAFWWTICTIFSVHYSLIIGLVFVVIVVVLILMRFYGSSEALSQQGEVENKYCTIFKTTIRLLAFLLLFNSFWLIPAIIQPVVSAVEPHNFGDFGLNYFQAYRTAADSRYGLTINLLGMYGFWRERTAIGEMFLAKTMLGWWPYLLAVVAIPMAGGLLALVSKKQWKLLMIVVLTGAIAAFLAAGPASGLVGTINSWIFLHLPGFKIMREAQKWLVLLVFCYSALIAWGFYLLQVVHPFYCSSLPALSDIEVSRTTQQTSRLSRGTSGSARKITFLVITIVFLVAICLYNFTIFWGANGHLKLIQYPQSWLESRKIIQNDTGDYRILILPWHQYVIDHPLSKNRTIVDPAPAFFYPAQILSSADESVAGIQHQDSAEENQIKILLNHPEPALWQKELQKMNIKYIFVSRVEQELTPKVYAALKASDEFESLIEDDYAGMLKVR